MSKNFSSTEHEVIFEKLIEGLRSAKHPIELQQVTSQDKQSHLPEIHGHLKSMLETRENYAYRYLHSKRKVMGPVILFGKKVVRKLLKWYVEPIAFQQTRFNNAVTPAIGRMTELISKLLEKTESLEQSYDSITKEFDTKQKQHEADLAQLAQKHEQYMDLVTQLAHSQEKYALLLTKMEQMRSEFVDRLDFIEKKQNSHAKHIEETTEIFDKLEEIEIFQNSNETFFEKKTHAQSGEDSILAYIIHVLGIDYEAVDYIDLGANHAKELSNTYYFYSKGAKGILVEANTELIPELSFYRHRDVILNKCVDVESGKLIEFYILNGDGLSTSDFEAATSYCEVNPALKIIDKRVIETISYTTIVEQYLGKAPTILSIDIEGMDLEVLQSIDYEKYRPLIIVTEMIDYDIKLNYNSKNMNIIEYLECQDYDEYAFTGINSIFLDKRYLRERNK